MDAIAAIATPPGPGGIGIVRISGPDARGLLGLVFCASAPSFRDFQPWKLHRGLLLDASGKPLDDCLAVFMPGPNTFTGEDVAEIHCHGAPVILAAAMESLIKLGARQAGRGEFTRRALLNGRMDLSQAEAVAELIAAPSREAAAYGLKRLQGHLGDRARALGEKLDILRALASGALDFPDDEQEILPEEEFASRTREILFPLESLLKGAKRAALAQNGARIVLIGAPNAGKSSLFNALAGRERALVTPVPGTTRDFIEERLDFDGLPVLLADTAGLRENADSPIEELGMARSRELAESADLLLLVLDGEALGPEPGAKPDAETGSLLALSGKRPVIMVWNKLDICSPATFPPQWAKGLPAIRVSAATGEGVADLASLAAAIILKEGDAPENGLAPNARQALALESAAAELKALLEDLSLGASYDCCVCHLDAAASDLGELLGLGAHDDLLDLIFSRFCIGK